MILEILLYIGNFVFCVLDCQVKGAWVILEIDGPWNQKQEGSYRIGIICQQSTIHKTISNNKNLILKKIQMLPDNFSNICWLTTLDAIKITYNATFGLDQESH